MYFRKLLLANLSGMAKDSAVKILREFQQTTLVRLDDHELEILNIDSLKRISRTG